MRWFAGGTTENPTYESVIQGETDYREAAQVYFSPEVISYEEVLQLYWSQIDPTDSGGQFSDRGFHYTTAIYYHSSEQKEVSEKSKKVLDKSSVYSKKIVTDILPFTPFFPAEDYHQDYYKNNDRSYDLYAKGSGRKGYIEEGVLADFKWPWQK